MKALLLTGVAAAALALAPTAHADVFDMCPDGHEGVVGDHTSCGFAENIRTGFLRFGPHFNAFSPATKGWYEVNCIGPAEAEFTNGVTVSAVNCFASNNAEAVVW